VVGDTVYIIGGTATGYPYQPFLHEVWEFDPTAGG
jgi:hypothetical protein